MIIANEFTLSAQQRGIYSFDDYMNVSLFMCLVFLCVLLKFQQDYHSQNSLPGHHWHNQRRAHITIEGCKMSSKKAREERGHHIHLWIRVHVICLRP